MLSKGQGKVWTKETLDPTFLPAFGSWVAARGSNKSKFSVKSVFEPGLLLSNSRYTVVVEHIFSKNVFDNTFKRLLMADFRLK